MIHTVYLVMRIALATVNSAPVPVPQSIEHTLADCQNAAASHAAEETVAKRSEWYCQAAIERDPK
jgi:hypothetical protein